MAAALRHHDAALRSAVEEHGGRLLKHTGDGVLAVFDDPLAAVGASVAAQRALRGDGRLRARMGLHLGPAEERDGDFFGPTLNRAARIMAAAHANQVLVSVSVASAVSGSASVRDLGHHRLKDLVEPEQLFQIVIDDAGAYPPPRSLSGFDQHLPRQRTRLIGRDQDLAKLRSLLDESPLVTLTGVGGVGKTRLAVEAAAREVDRRDGVVFVDLAPVADPALVPGAIAAALGLAPGQIGDDLSSVLRVLTTRSMLVVLDNCEHLLDAAASLAEEILDAAPRSVVLATSREPLGVDGEAVWRVPSLSDQALDLFVDRARAVRSDFALSAASAEAAREICEHLDGIPLAIELAAARVTHLSVEEIRDRLGERFTLLTGGRRRAQQRHQTLLAALDWSYDLLSDDERSGLCAAGVFTGGFTVDALDFIADGSIRSGALDVVRDLVDKSLVVPDVNGEGQMRYRLLETVRLYAIDRLSSDELGQARDRHAAWVASWLVRASGDGSRLIANPAISPQTEDLENVRAALDWAIERGHLSLVGTIAGYGSGVFGYRLVDEELRVFGRPDVEAALTGDDRGRYVLASAVNANALGDFALQLELSSRSLELLEGEDVRRAASAVLANALSIYDPERSKSLYREIVASAADRPALERAWWTGRAADPYLMTGELEAAADVLDRAQALVAHPDGDSGWPHLLLGRLDDVRAALLRLEAQPPIALHSYRLPLLGGLLAAIEGRLDDARRQLVTAARLIERFPARLADLDVVNGFAVLAYSEGDYERAATLLAVASQGPAWGRSPGSFALHVHFRRLVRYHLTSEEVARVRSASSNIAVLDALDAEVRRAEDRALV